jgi:hypothetical protein
VTESLPDYLRQIASDEYGRSLTEDDIQSPQFATAKCLETWEWYVDPRLREVWGALSIETRWVACVGALQVWRRENEAAF